MKKILYVGLMICLQSCQSEMKGQEKFTSRASDCRGKWIIKDEYGVVKKFNQFWHEGGKACLTEEESLTNWEKSHRKWFKDHSKCTPQTEIESVSLKAANNYYSYRDLKFYLKLDTETGIYKKLILGESLSGDEEFIREEGCFYGKLGLDPILFSSI